MCWRCGEPLGCHPDCETKKVAYAPYKVEPCSSCIGQISTQTMPGVNYCYRCGRKFNWSGLPS